MTPDLDLALAAALAFALCVALVPPVRALAVRTGFLDHPVAYKTHARPTPYLGGLAVMTSVFVVTLILGGEVQADYTVLVAGAAVMCALGCLDDRIGLPVAPRFAAQAGLGTILYAAGFHWELGLGTVPDLLVTVVWVIGIVNAFNLMDNLDGATGMIGAVSAAGAGILAESHGVPVLSELAFALAGACAGFLIFNLARPASIFLGDGGSMPLGFLLAGIVVAIPPGDLGAAALPAAVPLVGLVILDTALVVLSRRRRGTPVLSGARDHLTHRLLSRLGSAQGVAFALGAAQGALAGITVLLYDASPAAVATVAACYTVLGVATLALLETASWHSPQMKEQAAQAKSTPARWRYRGDDAADLETAS